VAVVDGKEDALVRSLRRRAVNQTIFSTLAMLMIIPTLGWGEWSLIREADRVSTPQAVATSRDVLIVTFVARISFLLVMLFLVQIMAKIFRFSWLLANYFAARADAIKAVGLPQNMSLGELVKIISPDAIDFGEMPKAVAEQVIELAQPVVKKAVAERD
jgi:hypothetical protein